MIDIFSRNFFTKSNRAAIKSDRAARRRSQLAQGCAAVRFALGHGKSISSVRFSLPFRSRGAIIVPSGSCGLGREEGKDDTFCVARKNSKIDISMIREFEPGRTIAKCLLIPRFDRNSQREKEFLDFKEEKERYGKN